MDSRDPVFPVSFAWGTTTNAVRDDGASESSDWRIRERSNLCPASGRGNDRYHRFDEDFMRLSELGLNHFRTSLDWSRLEPQKGVYDRVAIDAVRQVLEAADRRGLTIWLDLHHFALPAWFAKKGGFMDETATIYWHRFVEFAAKEFGGLVANWVPVHQPFTYAAGSNLLGLLPPGRQRMDKFTEMLIRVHKAHGDAYRILKTYLPARARVGTTVLIAPVTPGSDADKDHFSAEFVDSFVNRVTLDALLHGAVSVPGRGAVEVPLCRGAADFIGIDYLFRLLVGQGAGESSGILSELARIEGMPRISAAREGEPLTEEGYGAAPAGLYEAIKLVNQTQLSLPLYVTGVGIATSDEETRTRYLAGIVASLQRALVQGIDIRGCLLLSDVDGYEWNQGLAPHYGLFGFSPETFERQPRPAAQMISRVTHERKLPVEFEPPPEPGPAPDPPAVQPEY